MTHRKGPMPSRDLHRQAATHLSPRSHTMATMVAFSTVAESRSAALMAPPEDTPAKMPAYERAAILMTQQPGQPAVRTGELDWCDLQLMQPVPTD